MSAFLAEITGIFSYIDIDSTKLKKQARQRTNTIKCFGISVCVRVPKPTTINLAFKKLIDFKERKFIHSLRVHLE